MNIDENGSELCLGTAHGISAESGESILAYFFHKALVDMIVILAATSVQCDVNVVAIGRSVSKPTTSKS